VRLVLDGLCLILTWQKEHSMQGGRCRVPVPDAFGKALGGDALSDVQLPPP
jgi:hypothetical protein